MLHQNRAALAERGVLFPKSPGRRRHVRFGMYMKPDDQLVEVRAYQAQGHRTPAEFRRAFRRQLLREIRQGQPKVVLISDEALYGSDNDSLNQLRRFMDRHGHRLRLVCYLRRQDDHLISRYQQVVKVGETRTLAQRVAEVDQTHTYDYAARLDAWSRVVQPDEFVIRRFERGAFLEDSLYADFLDAAGLGVSVAELDPVSPQNESLDAESVEFLRLLNIYRVREEGACVGMINNRRVVSRLAQANSGPILTLPDHALDSFMGKWEHSNREVARRYFADPEGVLFRVPRRTQGTTIEQRLDPSRVEYFVKVAGLAEDLQGPLQRLAERESG
jgi:hypothetical protein